MSDPLPAAAIGLPEATTFDRRSFLATLAAAGVMGAAGEVTAAGDHPDAALIALHAAYKASDARLDHFNEVADEAYLRIQHPNIPEALFLRDDEPRHVITSSRHLTSTTIDGVERPFFEGGVKDLSRGAQQYAEIGEAYSHPMFFGEAARARVREINAAHEVYSAAVKASEDAAGYTGPWEAGNAEVKMLDDLIDKIARTRALTIEGIRIKARLALVFLGGDVDFVESEILPKLLAKSFNTSTSLGASLIVDLVKLDAPVIDRSAA